MKATTKRTTKRTVRRPADGRRKPSTSRRNRSYATLPLARAAKLALPKLGAQRSLALSISVFLAVMLIGLLALPQYAIAQIEIKGNQGTPTDDLRDALGFARGANSFLLRSQEVAEALKAVPGVEDADVQIALPGTLSVTIKDIKPEVFWQTNSQTLWVDAKGLVYEQPAVTPDRKLTIQDYCGRVYKTGDRVDPSALSGARELSVLLGNEVKSFEFYRDGELTVASTKGWKAQFNTRTDLQPQLTALRKTLSTVKDVGHIDVRVPTLVSYKLVGAQ